MDRNKSQITAKEIHDKIDSLLKNSEDFKINSTDELVKEFDKYVEENIPLKK